MGFRDAFGRHPKRFVTEEKFRTEMARQHAENIPVLDVLGEQGVAPDRELKLEYFFYTDTIAKAVALAEDLKRLGYEAHNGPSASDKSQQLITGWTTPLTMSAEVVDDWSKRMVELGFERDCFFDGWATDPTQ